MRRAFDLFPVTPLGLLLGAAAALGLRAVALAERDLVLLLACGALLVLAVAALVLVVLAAVRMKLALRRTPDAPERTLETGRSLPTGFALPGLLLVPLLRVRWSWLAPEAELTTARRGLRLEESADLRRRGYVEHVDRRVVLEDALGLARIAVRQRQAANLRVLPHPGALRELPLLVSMAGGDEIPHPMGVDDGDRVELRRYAPGDPARHIHWKVFSRTRRLMVRVPERALTRARRTVAYLVGGPDDEASAAAARVSIEGGALGGEWVFGADGTEGEAREVAPALDRVVRSAGVGDGGGLGLRAFVERAERTGPASLVVFAPARPGPWLDRVVAVLRPRAQRARVVIGVDGLDVAPVKRWWKTLLVRQAPRVGTPAEDVDAVVRALAALRCEVVLLDRRSGRRLGAAHREAARALAAAGRAA